MNTIPLPGWPIINPNVLRLPAYNAGMNIDLARKLSGHQDIAALASNENPDGCSPKVKAALASGIVDPSRYADPGCTTLKAALSDKLGVPVDRIVVGNGSEELIAAISRAFLMEGSAALTVAPSFGLHEIEPMAAGAIVTKIAMTSMMEFDLPAIEAELAKAPALFFLPSPSNPVGPALTRPELQRLLDATLPQTMFVLDEAYFEFVDDGYPDGIEMLRDSSRAYVVLRTFSKAYGLAGLRVGYAVCSDTETARVIGVAKPPFNVNAAAQVAAVAALADPDWMAASAQKVKLERERIRSLLMGVGLFVAKSQTNFLFFRTCRPSRDLAEALLADGIIVKPWREADYERFIRASIGISSHNDRLVASLKRALAM
jgi:histidinol-phosphate aminotransferase